MYPSLGMPWFRLWLLFCASCAAGGWILSIPGWLNGWGVLATLILAAVAVPFLIPSTKWTRPFQRWRRGFSPCRLRRLPYALYLLVFFVGLLGAVLYAPSNYDALCYRVPRALNWLAEGRWYWLDTYHQAVNTRTAVTEWMQVPFILISGSDRLLVIPNLISFLFLPGLVFSILRQLRICGRVAWHWMWIFPTGYCYALQFGGVGNDLTGAVFFLGGIHYALKAARSMAWSDFAWACVGMALATGSKTSNVPLGLPWLIAIAPAIPLAWRFFPRNLLLAPCLILISFLPNAFLNHRHCGDWTGLAAESVLMRGGDPMLYLSWNASYLLAQNIVPPIFPVNEIYNRKVKEIIPSDLQRKLDANFEPGASSLEMRELQIEESGSLGLGVTGLLVLGLAGSWITRRRWPVAAASAPPPRRMLWWIFFASLAALLPMLVKSGLAGSGRYLAPHYLLLVLPFFTPKALPGFLRGRIWSLAVITCFGMLLATMVLSPARPMWPALTILKAANAGESDHRALRRAWDVYTFYRKRPDAFTPLVQKFPAEATTIGILSGNTPEASLWKPFGKRRVIHIRNDHSLESIRDQGIEYIVAGRRTMQETRFPPLEEWAERNNASVVGYADVHLMVRSGVETWYILRVAPEPEP